MNFLSFSFDTLQESLCIQNYILSLLLLLCVVQGLHITFLILHITICTKNEANASKASINFCLTFESTVSDSRRNYFYFKKYIHFSLSTTEYLHSLLMLRVFQFYC